MGKMKEFFMSKTEDFELMQGMAEDRLAQEEAFYEHTIMSVVDLMLSYGYNNVLSAIHRKYDDVARTMGILEESE